MLLTLCSKLPDSNSLTLRFWKTGIDLRRTEIVCVTWSIQNLCGSAFMGYSTYFYEQAGLPIIDSFDMSMAQVLFPHYKVPLR